MDLSQAADIFAAQVRAIQSFHPQAHAALLEWGIWSRDRAGIFPALAQNSMWDQFVHDEMESWGEVSKATIVAPEATAKSERDEERAPDEKLAIELDEWMHRNLDYGLRRTLLVAYVLTMAIYQYPRAATSPREPLLQPEGYLARLGTALMKIEARNGN